MADFLLARYADAIFWLARYVERAENLARILDVNLTFSRDSQGDQNWLSILQLHEDEEDFATRHDSVSADAVLRYYVTDTSNPTSIVSTIWAARQNGLTVRPFISLEMWNHLNSFNNRLGELDDDGVMAPGNLSRLFAWIKEVCEAHTGIAEGTFYRDQVWYFYVLGRNLERADQTTRLLDMKYHLLLPKVTDVGSPIDTNQWNALLRSAAGYQAYRRLEPGGITPARVAGLLLHDPRFPRSVQRCVRETSRTLLELKSQYFLRGGNEAAEKLDRLQALIGTMDPATILKQGLHQYLDLVQQQLAAVTEDLSAAFFGHSPRSAESMRIKADGRLR